MKFSELWRNKLALGWLAAPGVIAVIGLTALMLLGANQLLDELKGFGLRQALMFGAIIAATDPVAVLGVFGGLSVPRRLKVLVGGESLLNDGTGIVLFNLVLGLSVRGDFSALAAAIDFARVVGLGALLGVATGLVISRLIKRLDDPMVEITLTLIAAYGTFVLAEHFHVSGVIATVVAGTLCGTDAHQSGMSEKTMEAVNSFWDYLAFALNSVVFLLIGIEVEPVSLLHAWEPILLAYGSMTAARGILLLATSSVLRFTRESFPWKWTAVLAWGGLRGALAMVLALGLPLHFAGRGKLITMTFGAVVLSIVVQGLSMPLLLRWAHFDSPNSKESEPTLAD